MEALQYIYTSWKNGDSTEKGYMIYSRSEGISESECTAIKDLAIGSKKALLKKAGSHFEPYFLSILFIYRIRSV